MRIPKFIMKELIKVSVSNKYLHFKMKIGTTSQPLRRSLEDLVIKLDDTTIFDAYLYPNDFHIRLNGVLYQNKDLNQIQGRLTSPSDGIEIIIVNRFNIFPGEYKFSFKNRDFKIGATAKLKVIPEMEYIEKSIGTEYCRFCGVKISNKDQKYCEFCGANLRNPN